jgi:hypothetical protein
MFASITCNFTETAFIFAVMQAKIQTKSEKMQKVKPEVIEKLKGNVKALNRLAYEFNKHRTTVDRWVLDNNIILTTPMAVKAIAEELGIEVDQVLEGE